MNSCDPRKKAVNGLAYWKPRLISTGIPSFQPPSEITCHPERRWLDAGCLLSNPPYVRPRSKSLKNSPSTPWLTCGMTTTWANSSDRPSTIRCIVASEYFLTTALPGLLK